MDEVATLKSVEPNQQLVLHKLNAETNDDNVINEVHVGCK
jgi:hypothetical protein